MNLTVTEINVLNAIRDNGGSARREQILPESDKGTVDDALFCLVNQTPYLEEEGGIYRLALISVTIMYRNGGDGWQYGPRRIQIAANCPACGGPRGPQRDFTFCEDGEWFTVDTWKNPCGHVDDYRDCWHEAKRLRAEQKEGAPQ